MLRILILLIALTFSWSSNPADTVFQKANALYKAEQYQQAVDSYQSLISHVKNGPIFYNLGNSYYKLGRMIDAKYFYEKAALYMPEDRDLQANLKLVNKQFQDRVDGEIQILPVLYQWIAQRLSMSGIIWLAIVLITLGTLMAGLYKASIGRQFIYRGFVVYGLIVLLFAFFFLPRFQYFYHPNKALIFAERVEVKSGPDDKLATLFILHQGAMVTVLQSSGSWLSIQLDKNYSGWVPAEILKLI